MTGEVSSWTKHPQWYSLLSCPQTPSKQQYIYAGGTSRIHLNWAERERNEKSQWATWSFLRTWEMHEGGSMRTSGGDWKHLNFTHCFTFTHHCASIECPLESTWNQHCKTEVLLHLIKTTQWPLSVWYHITEIRYIVCISHQSWGTEGLNGSLVPRK